MILYLVTLIIALISWDTNSYGLLVAPFISLIWKQALSKKEAFIIALLYYLPATSGLVKGAGVFFGNPTNQEIATLSGLSIWLSSSIFLALPWGMLWDKSGYFWRIPIILVIISIPPIGLCGFVNPITASGILFPEARWLGLIATIILMILFCYFNKGKFIGFSLVLILVSSIILNFNYKEASPPKDWISLNTNFGWLEIQEDEYLHQRELIEKLSSLIDQEKPKVILLPELILGNWTETNKYLWRHLSNKAEKEGITILIGVKQWLNPSVYISGLITIGKNGNQILPDRVPVPISMWRPWTKTKSQAKSFWFNSGIHYIADKKIATIICYEQVLIWPILYSFLYNPQIILASSNVWWAKDTNIPDIQHKSVSAWSRLFNIPLLEAVNSGI